MVFAGTSSRKSRAKFSKKVPKKPAIRSRVGYDPTWYNAAAIKRKLAINSCFGFVLLRHATSPASLRKPTGLKKTCGPQKADRQAGFFLMRRLLTRPRARS